MKKTVLVFVVLLLMASNNFSLAENKTTEENNTTKDNLKVLVDESRVHSMEEGTCEEYIAEMEEALKDIEALFQLFGMDITITVLSDERYSFNNLGEPWGFGLAGGKISEFAAVTIKESGELTYSQLMRYDVLVIASFAREYTPAEVDAIKRFVENGGGLFLLADIDSKTNSVSQVFGVSFCEERAVIADDKAEPLFEDNHVFYVGDIATHPITHNVKKIALNNGIPITTSTGDVLIRTSTHSWIDHEGDGMGTKDTKEKRGPFDICVAVDGVGRGRAVFFGGAASFWNSVVITSENLDLFGNAVKWLGEPGGPYQQYQRLNEQAQALLQEGVSLYNTHQFTEGGRNLQDAISVFEESNETYPNSEAIEALEEAQKYKEKCETGQKADHLFERAEAHFGQQEYEEAIAEYERAEPLFEEVAYTERVEMCRTKIDEITRLIALREEAASLFGKAEKALEEKTGFFDVSGYETARTLFEQSQKKWGEYNDAVQVALCEERIVRCNNDIARVERTKILFIVIIIGCAGAGCAGTVIVVRKRS